MKLMFASDIHGDAACCGKMLERLEKESPDKLVLLGDLLYHGPRNDLPGDYRPKEVIAMLNGVKSRLLCVRGNCEAQVDQMVLDFPVNADLVCLWGDGHTFLCAHGHLDAPPLCKGDILATGHTHIPLLSEKDGIYFVNPGSVSLPKNNSRPGYAVYENGLITLKELNGGKLFSMAIGN